MLFYKIMIMWFGWIQLFIIVINGFKSTIKQMKTTRLFTIPPPSNKQTVWNVFGEIAATTGASNLGQGFPDWNPPPFVIESLMKAVSSPQHQYTRPSGYPPLVKSLASAYSTHLNREIDPFNEIVITVGASQALYLTFMTLLQPDSGDEVIIFEPFFDLYLRQLKLVPGVVPKFVILGGEAATEDDPWALDIGALRSAITPKTKILLLNTPHNPTGKVFSYKELVQIAEIVKENPQITVISDEVYKFSVYNPVELGDSFAKGHFHFARLEGMWERTITISSCGKTFSVTGWQVGWMVAPTKYTLPIQDIIPCIQFCASTPIQAALSYAISQATQPYEGFDTYYEWLRCQFSSKRIVLEAGLKSVGIEPLQSRGGFFLLAKLPDVPILSKYDKYDELYDWKYCRMLAHECGIVGIPASSFFSPTSQHGSKDHMARFAFCKKDETMTLATEKCYKYAITTATTNTLLSATNKSIIVL